MRTHAEETFNGYGPLSMSGPDLSVVYRRDNDVAVIDLAGPLVGDRPVHALHDRILHLLDAGTKNFAITSPRCPTRTVAA